VAEAKTVRAVGKLDTIKQFKLLQNLDGPKDGGSPYIRVAPECHVP
jgi:hypothetical protein